MFVISNKPVLNLSFNRGLAVLTVLAVVENVKLSAGWELKANLSQKAKDFVLLRMARSLNRSRSKPKLNTSVLCNANLKKFCYLKLINQVQSLASSAKMQNPQIYCRNIGQIFCSNPNLLPEINFAN